MSDPVAPRAPADLRKRGRLFWREVVGEFELSTAERAILHESCRLLDEIDELKAAIAAEGVTVEGSNGQPVAHPGYRQIQAARTMLARLVGQLELPAADGDPVPSVASLKAKRAAAVRWRSHNLARAAADG